MSENLQDIEDLFRDAIEDHQVVPDDNVWDSIDHRLDKMSIVKAERKYIQLKRLSFALLLLLIGAIVYQLSVKRNSVDNNNLAKTPSASQPVNNNDTLADVKASESHQKDLLNKKLTGHNNIANTLITAKKTDKEQINSPVAAPETTWNRSKENGGEKTPVKRSDESISNHLQFSKKIVPGKIKNGAENNPAGNLVAGNNKDVSGKTMHPTENTIGDESENDVSQKGSTVKNLSYKNTSNSYTKNKPASKYGQRIRAAQQKEMNNESASRKEDKLIANDKKSFSGTNVDMPLFDAAYFAHSAQVRAPLLIPGIALIAGTEKIVVLKKAKPFHFAVMPFFSPQFGFNRILDDDDHNNSAQGRYDRDDIKRDEKDQLSYSLGVLIEIPLKKKWSLQSGLSFTNKNLEIEPKKIYAQLDNSGQVKYRFDCSCGFTYLSPKTGTTPVVGDSIITKGSSNNLKYIGIPLIINYTFLKRKFNIVPSLGAAVNFLVNQRIQTSLTGAASVQQSITDIQGLRKTYFNTITTIALQYNLTKKISANITPAVNFALSTINRNAAVKSYPNSFAVAAAIKIQL